MINKNLISSKEQSYTTNTKTLTPAEKQATNPNCQQYNTVTMLQKQFNPTATSCCDPISLHETEQTMKAPLTQPLLDQLQ